jgi:hypothetical protein
VRREGRKAVDKSFLEVLGREHEVDPCRELRTKTARTESDEARAGPCGRTLVQLRTRPWRSAPQRSARASPYDRWPRGCTGEASERSRGSSSASRVRRSGSLSPWAELMPFSPPSCRSGAERWTSFVMDEREQHDSNGASPCSWCASAHQRVLASQIRLNANDAN